MAGITAEPRQNAATVVPTLRERVWTNTASIPSIVTNPALGIGAPNVGAADARRQREGVDRGQGRGEAQRVSAGSGTVTKKKPSPAVSTTSEVDLTANPSFLGPKPKYSKS